MTIENFVLNQVKLDSNSVWVLEKPEKFSYSDGVESEVYLKNVLSKAVDISSDSYELEEQIIDWNSEYHLSRKRSQILKAFKYKKNSKVLEVGSGCGAITRFLGETFETVIGIEGSIARATIARERTRDLPNVSIICAPFQEIVFKEKFDIIFCIGVFEYSNMFVNNQDPYNYILNYFSEILNPNGEIVIAIENQFGIKYFSSAPEDHSGVEFDGLEGYHRFGNSNAKTFGYYELTKMLSNKFRKIDFYFPFPDYKLPSCLVSQNFLNITSCAELVGSFKENSLLENYSPLFSESHVLGAIEQNKMLHFFANSFLIIANKGDETISKLEELGIIFSSDRVKKFQTKTSFFLKANHQIQVDKQHLYGENIPSTELVSFKKSTSLWIEDESIHKQLITRSKNVNLRFNEIFLPCQLWIEKIISISFKQNENLLLEGKYLDAIWCNSFIVNDDIVFIDQEWELNRPFGVNRLVIKSILEFLNQLQFENNYNSSLRFISKKAMVIRIAKELGITISNKDINDFCMLEAELAVDIYGKNKNEWILHFKMDLMHSGIIKSANAAKKFIDRVKRKFLRILK